MTRDTIRDGVIVVLIFAIVLAVTALLTRKSHGAEFGYVRVKETFLACQSFSQMYFDRMKYAIHPDEVNERLQSYLDRGVCKRIWEGQRVFVVNRMGDLTCVAIAPEDRCYWTDAIVLEK